MGCKILILIFLAYATAQNTTFCRDPYTNLCHGENHIACINYFKQVQQCPNSYSDCQGFHQPFMRDFIVNFHNQRRNRIAGGLIRHLPHAKRMLTVVRKKLYLTLIYDRILTH